jgi:hypothetical protein
VAGVLLEQVKQDPLQGRRVGAVPALTGLAHVIQVVGGDDGPAPLGLVAQVSQLGRHAGAEIVEVAQEDLAA